MGFNSAFKELIRS